MQDGSIVTTLSELLFGLSVFVKTFFQALGIVPAPCEHPIQYTVGAIDSRFDISDAQVVEALGEAEKLWEDASGINLFEYSATQGLPVKFVYDERQEKTEAGKNLQEKLDSLGIGESEQAAKEQIARYESAKTKYEKLKSAYESDSAAYNERVKKINRAGGASEKQQNDLAQQYQALQEQFNQLEDSRQSVNSLVGTTNQRIAANETLVNQYNKEITTFQDQYGGEGQIFDQGVYTGRDITIYQYDDKPRLVLVLAHEMGHALGIDHLNDPSALMYYLMRDQDVSNIHLSDEDKNAIEEICQKPKFPWQG